ncbi:hypothetical protein DMN91_008411 [Ooceraea biroi]|uniref:Uncharacterized protein n=1 Tax=Ooceraea biroi TaxID=2015173 RepID=A0A3L8DI28_OOCBI|nr:hypothetical protein DMN91_008411 [Ooceraea biroi]
MRSDEIDEISAEKRIESEEEDYRPESRAAGSTQDEAATAEEDSSVSTTDPAAKAEKIKELVSTEINLEQQLENVQRQLLALKQLPSEIENHLRIVSDQLHKIMELSGMQGFFGNGNGGCHELSGSFEPDLKLSPKDQVIQELQQKVHKRGRKHSQELWPQAKQLELTQGRRWRCPNDFFNDEMIAEVLSCQAEVIRGKAMG